VQIVRSCRRSRAIEGQLADRPRSKTLSVTPATATVPTPGCHPATTPGRGLIGRDRKARRIRTMWDDQRGHDAVEARFEDDVR
jgi:hypothetical protein